MSEKFNELIELIISEETDKAKALFHDIVVDKSRGIYENLIDDEAVEEEIEESDIDEISDEQTQDFISDIDADQEGLAVSEEADEDEMEERLISVENEMDELKAEFEKIMGGEDDEMDADMEPEMDADMDMEPEGDMDMKMDDDMEESMVEGHEMKAVNVSSPDGSDTNSSIKEPNKDMKTTAKASMSTGSVEKGRAAPKAQDMGSTTEPNMKKV
jgi:pilus assembly protein FimV